MNLAKSNKTAYEIHRMADCLEHIGEAVLMTDTDGTICYINSAFTVLTEYSEEEVLGKKPNVLRSDRHPKDFYTDLWFEIKAGKVWRGEVLNVKKNGNLYIAELTIAPVYNDEKNTIGYVSIQNDVTDKKRVLEELQEKNKELETFNSIVAHDLKSPLGNIQGYCETLRENSYELKIEDIGSMIDRICSLTKRSQNLIHELLDYSQLDQKGLDVSRIDLNNLMDSIKQNLSFEINQKNAIFEIGLLPVITANQMHITQLFSNLIGNALKYQETDKQPIIKVYGKDAMGFHTIYIEDNGIGFEPSQKESIFKPFNRLATEKKYEGTGIGLAICDRIMKLNEGKILAQSQPGQGSTFILRFPKTKFANLK